MNNINTSVSNTNYRCRYLRVPDCSVYLVSPAYCCISVIAFIFTLQILIEQNKVKIFSHPSNYSVKPNKWPVIGAQILYSPVFCHSEQLLRPVANNKSFRPGSLASRHPSPSPINKPKLSKPSTVQCQLLRCASSNYAKLVCT